MARWYNKTKYPMTKIIRIIPDNRKELLGIYFTEEKLRQLENKEYIIKHLQGDVWIGIDSKTGLYVWRCIDCFLKENLPEGFHSGEIRRFHLVGMAGLMEQKGCPDCGAQPFHMKPAGHCWACKVVTTKSDWNFQDTRHRMMQLWINYHYLREDKRPVDWKPVTPEDSPGIDLFLRFTVEKDDSGTYIYTRTT